jgi:hypothetical protein
MRRRLLLPLLLATVVALAAPPAAQADPNDHFETPEQCTTMELGLDRQLHLGKVRNAAVAAGVSASLIDRRNAALPMSRLGYWHDDALAFGQYGPIRYMTSGGLRDFTFLVVQAVGHIEEGCNQGDDRYRYRTDVSCNRHNPETGGDAPTICNYDAFQASLMLKGCTANEDCPWQEPWGRGNFEANKRTSASFTGMARTIRDLIDFSVLTHNRHLQARLLLADLRHLG